MKTYSSELFDLIKTLSTQEKKQIRSEMARDKKDKKTLLLYDIIDKQKIFNEEVVQKKLGNPKWYSQLKKYLLEQITHKIYSGSADRKDYTYVLKLITIAELFYTKGLMDPAKKKLEQASALCKANGWIEYIPIINARISNIIGQKEEQRKNYAFYTEAYKALNQSYLEKKYSLLFRCVEFSGSTKDAPGFLKGLLINECLADEKHLTTLLQKLHYYQFLASYYKSIELDHTRSYFYCKKYLEVVIERNKEEGNKDILSDEQRHVLERNNIVGLMNVIIAAVNANFLTDLDELFHSFLRLETRFKIDENNKLYGFYSESREMLFFLISTVNYTRRGRESPDFKSYLSRFYLFEKDTPHRTWVALMELITFYFFMKRDWNSCLNAINAILNDSEVYKTYSDVYSNILLLRLFVNYETNDPDILDYNLKKAERYFEKHYSPLEYEKIILLFFSELKDNTDVTGQNKVMKKYKELFNYRMGNDKRFALTYLTDRIFIDFESWLESKIGSRTLVVLLEEKYRGNEII